jgi:DNA-binding MarR family transcriptional regulator
METFEQLLGEFAQHPVVDGVSPSDLLDLPDPLRTTLNRLLRKGRATLGELASDLQLGTAEAQPVVDLLIEKGFLRADRRAPEDDLTYRVRTRRIAGRMLPPQL